MVADDLTFARAAKTLFVVALVATSLARAIPIDRVSSVADNRLALAYNATSAEQRWSMFSNPGNISRRTVAEIRFADGSKTEWNLSEPSPWRVLALRRVSKATEAIQDPDAASYWPVLADHVEAQAELNGKVVVDVVLLREIENPPNLGQEGPTIIRMEPFYSKSGGILPWDVDGYVE